MVVKQYFNQFEPGLQEEGDHQLQDFDEAEEETLSLCDLAVNSNSEDYWNAKQEDCQSASDDQDFFEFFSEDFTASLTYPKEDIIFCGKLIPYKEVTPAAAYQEQTQNTNTQKSIKKSGIFPWKLNSFKSRSSSSKVQQQVKSTCNKSLSQKNNGYDKLRYEYNFSIKKLPSTVATVSVKPRWYLFAFGYGRFSTEMELRDIKNRQSRRIPATLFQSSDGGSEMMKRSETQKRSPSWKSLWTFLRVLGCKRQLASAVAKA